MDKQERHLHQTNVARDLTQMAELVEICFPDMDENGRAAVKEMKSMGALGPLLLPLLPFDRLGIGIAMGYVWREGKKVRGNVSHFRADPDPLQGGGGFYIANVAVHPDYRRRGIARAMMIASLEKLIQWGGRWASLQVDKDNEAAIALYHSLGFYSFEVLEQWSVSGLRLIPEREGGRKVEIRPRRWEDREQEIDLVMWRARKGGMAWTQPIGISEFNRLSTFDGKHDFYVMPDPDDPEQLAASIWLTHSGWKRTQISLFIDPAVSDPFLRRALLIATLRTDKMLSRIIRLELAAGDKPVTDLLRGSGFIRKRELLQMRIRLDRTL